MGEREEGRNGAVTEKLMREKIDRYEGERKKKDAEALIQTNANSSAGISVILKAVLVQLIFT